MTHFDGFRQQSDEGVIIPPPPRGVPTWFFVHRMKAAVFCAILLSGLGVIFGTVFFILMLANGALPTVDWAIDRNVAKADGQITNTTVLRHTQINNRNPWRVEYDFELPNGENAEGAGYLFEEELTGRGNGDALAIEYDATDSSHSRPVGGSAALLRGAPLLIIGCLIGREFAASFVFVLWVLLESRRQRTLLVYGAPAQGRIERVTRVSYIRFGSANPYNVYYRFDDANRRPQRGWLRTYRYKWAAGLSPGSSVGVVYDPYSPQRNTLWLENDVQELAGAA